MKKRPKIKITPKQGKEKTKVNIAGKDAKVGKDTPLPLVKLIKKYKIIIIASSFLLVFFTLFWILKSNKNNSTTSENLASTPEPPQAETVEINFGKDLNLSEMLSQLKQRPDYNQSMTILDTDIPIADLLSNEGLPDYISNELSYLSKANDIQPLKVGKSWYTITSRASDQSLQKMYIYQANPAQYCLITALPEPTINCYTKAEKIKNKSIAGIIKTNLWDAIIDNGGDHHVINKMEDALKYVVDFYHVKPNDKFRLLYEEKWVDGKKVDVGKLLAISFETNNEMYYAIYYKNKQGEGYVDEYGNSMKKKFLKSPVKYNRITSPYNPKRIHPVLGGIRPHLGTDYYAELGSPIFAVADGTVSIAAFKKNNGNYVKIRHDAIYETQYLHIKDDGFAAGIKPGAKVKQGQVIGYAGKTGLATGVHVCFRFWKNGKQVDPLKEVAIQTESIPPLEEEAFYDLRDSLLLGLEQIPYFDLSF